MGDSTWKAVERVIARKLGGRRVPLSGALDGRADVVTAWCCAEVKTKKRLPQWLLAAMAQARRAASDGQLPAVVLHQVGQRHANDLVVVRMADFTAWFGPLVAGGGASGAGAEEDGD